MDLPLATWQAPFCMVPFPQLLHLYVTCWASYVIRRHPLALHATAAERFLAHSQAAVLDSVPHSSPNEPKAGSEPRQVVPIVVHTHGDMDADNSTLSPSGALLDDRLRNFLHDANVDDDGSMQQLLRRLSSFGAGTSTSHGGSEAHSVDEILAEVCLMMQGAHDVYCHDACLLQTAAAGRAAQDCFCFDHCISTAAAWF